MDEKMQLYKKSKQYKIKIAINIFLVLVFFAIVGCAVYFYKSYNTPEKPYDESKTYHYEFNNNVVTLYSDDVIEGAYACSKPCEIYKGTLDEEYYYKGKILIKENMDIFLYDLLNNKKSSVNFNRIEYILDGSGNGIANVKLFKVNDSLGKQGIMNLDGSMIADLSYDEIGKAIDTNFFNYSYSKMYITAQKDGKWGLISLTNGKTIINFQYDDIKLSPYNKIAVKESNFWFIIDDSNKKIIPKGYASLDIFEKYIVVSEDRKAFVLDLLGNVVSNKIDLYYDVNPWASITIHGLESKMVDGKIHLLVDIPININAGTYQTKSYYYNEETKEISALS